MKSEHKSSTEMLYHANASWDFTVTAGGLPDFNGVGFLFGWSVLS